MRASLVLGWLLLALCLPPGGAALAEEKKKSSKDDESEFNPAWSGIRLGAWYRPEFKMRVQANASDPNSPSSALLGTPRLDVEEVFEFDERVKSEWMFRPAILDAELLIENRWISVSFWTLAPSYYENRVQLTQDVDFAGESFATGTWVKTVFKQWQFGLELRVNIFNDEVLKLSPVLGLRFFGFDWEIHGENAKAITEHLKTHSKLGDDRLLPYADLGLEFRGGLREYVEFDARCTGSMGSFLGYEAFIIDVQAGLSVWIYDIVGIRVGYRFYKIDAKSKHSERRNSFNFNLEFHGPNIAIMFKFG